MRTHYRVVFSGRFEQFDPKEHIVDPQDKDEVYYLFHVYISDPDVTIYVCYNDGTEKKIVLEDSCYEN